MSEVGMNPGEMALSPNDLTSLPGQNKAERSPAERAVAAGMVTFLVN